MRPAHARDEEGSREHGAVDERRPDVRLHEDEEHRPGREQDRAERDREPADLLRAVGEVPGEEERDQHLAELGRLEAEEAEIDPAPRAARHRARGEDEGHHREQGDIDDARETPVDLGVDEDRNCHQDEPDPGVDALARGGAAARVELRDPVDRPEPVGDRREHGRQQQQVEAAHDLEHARVVAGTARPQAAGAGVDGFDPDVSH